MCFRGSSCQTSHPPCCVTVAVRRPRFESKFWTPSERSLRPFGSWSGRRTQENASATGIDIVNACRESGPTTRICSRAGSRRNTAPFRAYTTKDSALARTLRTYAARHAAHLYRLRLMLCALDAFLLGSESAFLAVSLSRQPGRQRRGAWSCLGTGAAESVGGVAGYSWPPGDE